MSMYWYICHESDIRLWNLTSRERVKRMLDRMGHHEFLSHLENIPADSSVFIIRGDFIFDERVFRSLSQEKNIILEMDVGGQVLPVVAHVEAPLALSVSQGMQAGQLGEIPNLQRVSLEDLSGSFSNELRKTDHPYVFPIREDNRGILEQHLFSGSYKSVTDFVTKFWWPVPGSVGHPPVCNGRDITKPGDISKFGTRNFGRSFIQLWVFCTGVLRLDG